MVSLPDGFPGQGNQKNEVGEVGCVNAMKSGRDWPSREDALCVCVCVCVLLMCVLHTSDGLCFFFLFSPLKRPGRQDFYAEFPIFKILCK